MADPCPSHPAITLPHLILCPLCVQAHRAAEYARQRQQATGTPRLLPLTCRQAVAPATETTVREGTSQYAD